MSDVNSSHNFSVDSQVKSEVERYDLDVTQPIEPSAEGDLRERQACQEPASDWSDRAYKLRQKNRDFCKKIEKLEQHVAESQEQLKTQQQRAENAESLIAKQTEALGNSQKQFNRVLQELEAVRQEVKLKQTSIENLLSKLEASQEQVARIERECAILQESYHEQQYKLLETEQQARELSVRLYRQQRYTLQYKTALEQNTAPAARQQEILNELDSTTLNLNGQPIEAWSIPNRELKGIEHLNLNQSIKLEPEKEQSRSLEAEKTLDSPSKSVIPPKLPFHSHEESYLAANKEQVENAKRLETTANRATASSSNSPSPIIAAAASSKKRKSLAAIELPTFPRYRAY
jgi:hypothetical protein